MKMPGLMLGVETRVLPPKMAPIPTAFSHWQPPKDVCSINPRTCNISPYMTKGAFQIK